MKDFEYCADYKVGVDKVRQWLYSDELVQIAIKNKWDIYEVEHVDGEDKRRKLSPKEIEDLKINNPFIKKQEQEMYTRDEVLAIIAEALGGEPK